MFREDFAPDVAAYPCRGEIRAGEDKRQPSTTRHCDLNVPLPPVAAYTALMIFSTSSFSPLKPGERED